MAATVAPE